MKFPNAAEGVSKLYIGRLLGLISSACMIAYNVLSIFTAASDGDYRDMIKSLPIAVMLIVFFVSIAMLVIGVLSIVFEWTGLFKAGKDEKSFKIAFFAVIAGFSVSIVFTVLIFVLKIYSLSYISSVLTSIIGFVYYMFLFKGLRKLCLMLGDYETERKGKVFFIAVSALIVLELIASITVMLLGGRDASVLASSVNLSHNILSLAQGIVIFIYIAKAKKLLNE